MSKRTWSKNDLNNFNYMFLVTIRNAQQVYVILNSKGKFSQENPLNIIRDIFFTMIEKENSGLSEHVIQYLAQMFLVNEKSGFFEKVTNEYLASVDASIADNE